jgi:hypothetical protein
VVLFSVCAGFQQVHGKSQQSVGSRQLYADQVGRLVAQMVTLAGVATAGLRFFPGYLSDTRREAIDETALAVQRVGHAELQLLNPGHQPLLLPLPANSAQAVPAAAAGAVAAAAVGGSLAVQPTDQRRSLGAVHVCEHTECRLSAEQLWENGGRPGSRKGKGELQRTKSAPP